MKRFHVLRSASFVALFVSSLAVFASTGTAQTVPNMTIEIHNNSDRYSIYPVLSTGGHFPIDKWMQAAFRSSKVSARG